MELIKNKSIGTIFVCLSFITALISIIRYLSWAPAHNALDGLVVASLVVGMVLCAVDFFKDEDLLIIVTTACFSFAVFKHLTNQVGSFVDAFQGINMFGDATQVGTIVSIAIVMGISTIAIIISGFMNREKI